MTKKIANKILNTLLDKYEKSKTFNNESKVKQRFKVNIISLFPSYADHANYDGLKEINLVINNLEERGFIRQEKSNSYTIESVYLELEQLTEIYAYLGRKPKKESNKELIELFKQYQNKNDILSFYCKEQLERIVKNQKPQYYNDDITRLKNLLLAIDKLYLLEEETFEREFSITLFHDSKAFNIIRTSIINLLYQYGDFPDKESILPSFNLVKTPSYVHFKGAASIQFKGQSLDLSLLNGDIGISVKLIAEIDSINLTGDKVITIENLTSFQRFNKAGFLVIYLGGFHNSVRKLLIQKIHNQNPTADYYHFGDIDVGGIKILQHLRKNTGVDFKAYKMDVETLKQYQQYSKALTSNDRAYLSKTENSEFMELFQYMLEHNCKLEQEAVQ